MGRLRLQEHLRAARPAAQLLPRNAEYLRAQRSHHYLILKNDKGVESVEDRGSDFDPGITTANSGWNAPLSDMARFAAFLTGKPGNDNVLVRASLEEMRRPGKPMPDKTMPDKTMTDQWMGLSTFIVKHGQATILGHTGSQGAYRGYLYFNPATSTAVICAFNTTSETSGEKVTGLKNRLFDFLAK
jgi:CubicO group peptidase (beta-lactamase class C family)